ncbi:hypothetical protein [Robertmurraya siralis]|uniref:hypothetical protein n=1 Tax=Robertmurraya siralis TaxID=77777 RepID=UPI001FD24280|nr:hypothetical protein [Robertmurraya siralis]
MNDSEPKGVDNVGYLSQVRAGGKQYIYLTEYCGNQEFNTKKETHVFSFGNSRIALLKMKRWLSRFETEFPPELIERGYTKKDLKSWIKTLESGITKTGKKFNVEIKKRAVF